MILKQFLTFSSKTAYFEMLFSISCLLIFSVGPGNLPGTPKRRLVDHFSAGFPKINKHVSLILLSHSMNEMIILTIVSLLTMEY